MSFLEIPVDTILIEAEEMGEHFANADSKEQAKFLIGMLWSIQSLSESAASGWWPFQCRAIAGEILEQDKRLKIANILEDLASHLKEPIGETPDEQA